ncbi:MAG: hypothetical protein OXC31_05375 [Spirochaetaceae bacterium]|nr:hypothetical protein [Spirochaetaceae bacterium]
MWLVIREDPGSAEATPPWGAATTAEYAERVSRNLAIIERNPAVKLNYDFGAYELADLVGRHPDLHERMRAMVASGQLTFVNGTYNQPHGQALSLEANIRQLVHGLRVYRELFGVAVTVHALQEPDYTNQTPQLLRAFGFEFAAYGSFLHDLITPLGAGPEPSLLYRWVGLDGSSLPLAVEQNGQGVNYDRRIPAALQQRETFVSVLIPDMDEFPVDEGRRYVALDDALREQLREQPPVVEARLQMPWSYVEGTDGEALMAATAEAEHALIAAETLGTLIDSGFREEQLDAGWRLWLQAQHHDALWHGAPRLRAASVAWCRDAARHARKVTQRVIGAPSTARDGQAVRLLTLFPAEHRGVCRVAWAGAAPAGMEDVRGHVVPVQPDPAPDSSGRLLVPFDTRGVVDTVLAAAGSAGRAAGAAPARRALTERLVFANPFYRAEVTPYGGIARVYGAGGRELFRDTATRTLASTTEGLREAGDGGRVPRPDVAAGWTEPQDTHRRYGLDAAGALTVVQNGMMHAYSLAQYESELVSGPVADVVVSTGSVGDIRVERATYLYHALPWIELVITCHFEETVIDEYAEDANKLCLWWPYYYGDLIRSGIPGGDEIPSRPEIGWLPVNWFDVDHRAAGNGGGYAVAAHHAFKTIRRAGRIGSVLAWGEDRGHFSNRNEALTWRNAQDLRLRGRRTCRFHFYPHDLDLHASTVPQWACALTRSPLAQQVGAAAPSERSLLEVRARGMVATSVRRRDDGLRVRFHEAHGGRVDIDTVVVAGRPARYRVEDLAGAPMAGADSYRIGELVVAA